MEPFSDQQIVFKINELNPDYVCITGHFIDASGIEESALRSLKSIVGSIYFTIGNHEEYEDLAEIVERLPNLGVNILRNKALYDPEAFRSLVLMTWTMLCRFKEETLRSLLHVFKY